MVLLPAAPPPLPLLILNVVLPYVDVVTLMTGGVIGEAAAEAAMMLSRLLGIKFVSFNEEATGARDVVVAVDPLALVVKSSNERGW